MSACQALVVLSSEVMATVTSRNNQRLGPTLATRRTNAASGRMETSGRRAVSDRNIRKPAATRNIDTPELPLRKNGLTQPWVSIQSTGHSCQPWESTTSTIAKPRSPSYRSTRRGPAGGASVGSVGPAGREPCGDGGGGDSTDAGSDMLRTVAAIGTSMTGHC